MPSLILAKNMSFKYTASFDKLEPNEIKSSIVNKIEVMQFEKTAGLLAIIQNIFGSGVNEVMNCLYTDTYVIQAIYRDNHSSPEYDNMIFVKREINHDDSYTFGESSAEKDPYNYMDVTLADITNIIRQKYINGAVYINDDIDDIEFIDVVETDNAGSLYIKHKGDIKTIRYINSVNIAHKLTGKNDISAEELEKELEIEMIKANASYIYTKKDFGYGSLNCFCQGVGYYKNEIVSELMSTPDNKETVMGDVIICLENVLNEDLRILSMDKIMFNKIRTFVKTVKSDYVPKNKHMYNLYYELA